MAAFRFPSRIRLNPLSALYTMAVTFFSVLKALGMKVTARTA
jgi:hypothetical protein